MSRWTTPCWRAYASPTAAWRHVVAGLGQRQGALPGDDLRERFAGDVFHGDIGRRTGHRAVEDLGDVRMPQPGGDAGLLQETLLAGRIAGQLRLEDLQDQQLREGNVHGQVDLAHRPAPQQLPDLVARVLPQFGRQPFQIGPLLPFDRLPAASGRIARVVEERGRPLGRLEQPDKAVVRRAGHFRGAAFALGKVHLDDGRRRRIQQALGKGHQVVGQWVLL